MINSLSFSHNSLFPPLMYLSLFPSNLNSSASMALCIIILYFLALSYPCSATVHSNETDKAALIHFKSQINDNPLGILSSWNKSSHFCQWAGVTCNLPRQRVTRLDLSNQNLVGILSPFIGNLSFLLYFNLSGNFFHKGIPPEIGRLPRIRMLNVSFNSLEGVIPINISRCSTLRRLSLTKNYLTGEIPSELSSLSKLEVISLNSNNFSGKIPASIGNVSSLQLISLRDNHLVGEIPHSIGRLPNITKFAAGGNKFAGVFPPPLYNLSTLDFLDLDMNNFCGSLRHDFGLVFPNLHALQLGGNHFTGSIPSSLSNASNLHYVDLPFNNFLGTIPRSFGNLNLKSLNVYENSLGRNGIDDLSFITSLTNCSGLQSLDISVNQFGGNLPHAITNLSTDLYYLALAALDISGSVPRDIARLVNLNVLALADNLLVGAIPASIGKLSKLNSLYLGGNKLIGTIPSSFCNLTQVLMIYLSENLLEGSIPSGLERCTGLTILDLSTNNFTGTIPKAIFRLEPLQELHVSNNSLGGPLPYEVEALEHLTLLDVSYNRFSGNIPSELGNCLTLEKLYMQGNTFEGNIPDLSKLKGLQIIDLSHNNLFGEFPKYMMNFTSLQSLNLSFNNLEGEVPMQGILKNASVVKVFENKNLCGGVRELNLKSCSNQKFQKPKNHLSWKLKLVMIIVSSILAVGFLLASLFFISKSKKEPFPLFPSLLLHPRITYAELYNATGGFSSTNLIGMGNFGIVYRGILNPGEAPIAVKVLNLGRHGASKSFMAECQVLATIRHRNLLKVLTICSSIDYKGNDFQALVYEFMKHGSLDTWLHPEAGQEQKHLSLVDRINIVFDVASALCYLHHECPTPIVHCDLKPSNVLLDDDMIAYVSDFGLAKLLPESSDHAISSSIGIRGTFGYAAPEYGMGGQISISGDVYSFGIFILEIFTEKRPTDEIFKDNVNIQTFVKLSLPERVMDIVDKSMASNELSGDATSSMAHQGKRTSQKIECLISIFEVGIMCSEESPRNRMSMRKVVTELHHIREKFLRR